MHLNWTTKSFESKETPERWQQQCENAAVLKNPAFHQTLSHVVTAPTELVAAASGPPAQILRLCCCCCHRCCCCTFLMTRPPSVNSRARKTCERRVWCAFLGWRTKRKPVIISYLPWWRWRSSSSVIWQCDVVCWSCVILWTSKKMLLFFSRHRMICVPIVHKPNIVQVKKKKKGKEKKKLWETRAVTWCLLNTCKVCSGQDGTMRNSYAVKKT